MENKEEVPVSKKGLIIRYSVCYGILIASTLTIFLSKYFNQDATSQTKSNEIFKILTDAFFAPGIIMTLFGLLIFSTNLGAFDIITFGMRRFADLFRRDLSRRDKKTYYDYTVERHKKKLSFGYLLIAGGSFVLISLIFLPFYYTM